MDMDDQIIVLLVYSLAIGLCMWRPASLERRVVLSSIAALLWSGLLFVFPVLRVRQFAFSALTFLLISWLFRQRPESS
jgi:hypothetical protein